jgi:hypothetical protein
MTEVAESPQGGGHFAWEWFGHPQIGRMGVAEPPVAPAVLYEVF